MAKKKYYAWILPDGQSGICETWDECEKLCRGVSGEKHKGFATYDDAWNFAYPNITIPETNHIETINIETANIPTANIPTTNIPTTNTISESESSIVEAENNSAKAIFLNKCLDEDNICNIDFDKIIEKTESFTFLPQKKVADKTEYFCEQYGFKHLSAIQKQAIESIAGKFLLFAVPGSGKTSVIVARAGFMVNSLNIDPGKIMSITFTKAAAKEMKERYCRSFKTLLPPDFRTLHSLCYSKIIPALKKSGYTCPNHLIGSNNNSNNKQDKDIYKDKSIFSSLFRDQKIHVKDFYSDMGLIKTLITGIKNKMLTQNDLEEGIIKINKKEYSIVEIYNAYQNILKDRDCLDFDDLIIHSLNGLKEYKEVLSLFRNKYQYLNVDEAQDNSLLQTKLIKLISVNDGNLFMVGDDDQSIYSFRGSNPQLLIQYGYQSNVNTLILKTNYRSDYEIITAAQKFIDVNKNRVKKDFEIHSNKKGNILPVSLDS